MDYLAHRFNVLPLLDAVERIHAKDIPDNALVLTFDDGYRDNFVHAYPILRRFSLPATIFLATAPLDSDEPLWHDVVFHAFRHTSTPTLSNFGASSAVYPLRTTREKLDAQHRVLDFLWTLDQSDRELWIHRLRHALCVRDKDPQVDLMLSWDEIRLMHATGICFGSHTVNHPILAKIPRDIADEEIRTSKAIIERRLGAPVKSFAYPNGKRSDFSDETKQLVRDAGYGCAVTTLFGSNGPDSDPFELRRLGPPGESLADFAVKLHWYKRHM
jgi:peptidoglycan/xylan/chitin deacetylase (PgdA/CDA1 family)